MFNSSGIAGGLSLVKIINGISKTLSIANQVIPIYQKAKPALSNIRNVFGILKEMNKPTKETKKEINIKPLQSDETKTKPIETKSPTFFL